MAVLYTIPRRNYPYGYGYPYYRPSYYPNYPYNPYQTYPRFKDPKYFAMNAESENEIISGIAKIIVNNKQELKDKLVQLGLACSCTIDKQSDADLSDCIVEGMDNKIFQKWLAEKIVKNKSVKELQAEGGDPVTAIASAVGDIFKTIGVGVKARQEKLGAKAKYKEAITKSALEYKTQQEKDKRAERTTNNLMIAGGALLLIGVGALIFFGSMSQKIKTTTA